MYINGWMGFHKCSATALASTTCRQEWVERRDRIISITDGNVFLLLLS